jgi:hypothetical protein
MYGQQRAEEMKRKQREHQFQPEALRTTSLRKKHKVKTEAQLEREAVEAWREALGRQRDLEAHPTHRKWSIAARKRRRFEDYARRHPPLIPPGA